MKKGKVAHIIKSLKGEGFYEFSKEYTRAYPDALDLTTSGHFCLNLNTEFWKNGMHNENELFSEVTISAEEDGQSLDCHFYYNLAYMALPGFLDRARFWGIPIVRSYSRMTKNIVLKRLEKLLLSFENETAFLEYLFKERKFILPKNVPCYRAMFHELSPDLPDGNSLEDFVNLVS